MKAKRIMVRVAGREDLRGIVVTQHTTAAEVLATLGLPDNHLLSASPGQPPFKPQDQVFGKESANGKLFADVPPC